MTKAEWQQLLADFVAGRTDGPGFERKFLAAHRAAVEAGQSVPYAVDLMFYEVDAYCADPALRDAADLDESQLREAATRLVSRLDEPWPDLGPPRAAGRPDKQLLDNFRRAAALLGLAKD